MINAARTAACSVLLAGAVVAGASAPAFAAGGSTDEVANPTVVGETVVQLKPPVTAPVKVKATKVRRPTTVVVTPSTPSTGPLAFTGSDAIVGGLVLGVVLLGAGGGLVLAGRRRPEVA